MLRRISGSSSMTSIFFISWFQNRQPDSYRCAMSDFALNPHLAVVQFHATFYEQQAQSGAGPASDVGAAMKGGKQHLLIVLRNPDSLIANNAQQLQRNRARPQTGRRLRFGVFHRVTQEVGQNVRQQSLVRMRWREGRAQRKIDGASAAGGGKDLIHDTAAKGFQVQRRRPEIQFAGVQAAEDQDSFHHPGHAARVSGDGLELFVPFGRLHLSERIRAAVRLKIE